MKNLTDHRFKPRPFVPPSPPVLKRDCLAKGPEPAQDAGEKMRQENAQGGAEAELHQWGIGKGSMFGS